MRKITRKVSKIVRPQRKNHKVNAHFKVHKGTEGTVSQFFFYGKPRDPTLHSLIGCETYHEFILDKPLPFRWRCFPRLRRSLYINGFQETVLKDIKLQRRFKTPMHPILVEKRGFMTGGTNCTNKQRKTYKHLFWIQSKKKKTSIQHFTNLDHYM